MIGAWCRDWPELFLLAGDRHHPQVEAVVATNLLDRGQGLGKVVSGVDEHDLDGWVHLGGEVYQHRIGH